MLLSLLVKPTNLLFVLLPILLYSSYKTDQRISIPACWVALSVINILTAQSADTRNINDIRLIKIATAQKLAPNVARLVIAKTCQVSTLPFPHS